MNVLSPVDSFCASFELVKGAGVEFSDPDDHPARGPEMEIESVDLLERSVDAHAAFYNFCRTETEIPNFRRENLFQSGSRDYKYRERICCSRRAQRIIL